MKNAILDALEDRYTAHISEADATIKINLVKEQNKFITRLGTLNESKIKLAKTQSTNREILATTISSKI